MNLYLFNATDSAAIYGIGAYLRELTQALEGCNINIHIIHLHSIRPEFEIVKTNEVENWYIPEIRNMNTFSGSTQKVENYYRNVIYLLRLYIKDTNDLIFHFNHNQSQALAKGLKEVFDCRTVAVVHYVKWMLELHGNLQKYHMIKSKPENQRTLFEQLLHTTDEYENALYKEADRVIALSQYMQHILVTEYQLNRGKISVISNGLEDITPLPVNEKEVLRRKWRISGKEFIILFTGRLHPVKGLSFLIKAFRRVLVKIPDCRLMIAGGGDYDIYLKEAKDICTRITFTGLLEKEELYDLYSIADLGVTPSFHEQCSYVAIEMMMHGLPVIGSTSTGLKEMIVDGETGLHIPVIEYDDRVEIDTSLLAEKILYLLQHPEERLHMGVNARRRYLEKYSLPVFRKNMLDFYQSLFKQTAL